MEIAVLAECKLTSYTLVTESLQVYEQLFSTCKDPFTPGGSLGTPDADGIASQHRRFFYYEGEGDERIVVWVHGPDKRVKVTVEDV